MYSTIEICLAFSYTHTYKTHKTHNTVIRLLACPSTESGLHPGYPRRPSAHTSLLKHPSTRGQITHIQRSLIFLSPPLGFMWACQVTSSLPVHIYIVLCMLPTECRAVFCKLCRNCVNCRSNQVKWLLSFQAKFTCSLIIHLIIWKMVQSDWKAFMWFQHIITAQKTL